MNEAREQELIRAAKENEAAKAADVENLKEKYSGTDEKIYTVTTTVQVDDDTEEEFSYLFVVQRIRCTSSMQIKCA